jgi:uncharacterized membrane protein
MITNSIEINRPPEDVFRYLDQLDRHGEWDEAIQETRIETDPPTRVGSRATDTRKVPGGPREISYEITEHDPPRRSAFRGLNGPVRPVGTITVEATDDGSRSQLTLAFNLEGHGLGKLIAPLARRDARKQIPKSQQRLKERLDSGA